MISDQYAGQMMKCPLCQATFTAPMMPPSDDDAHSAPAAESPVPPSLPSTPDGHALGGSSNTFSLEPDQTPAEPNFSSPPPPSTPPKSSAPEKKPAPQPAPTQRTGGYTNSFSITFPPEVLRWFPGGAMLLVFLLSFFTWVYFGMGSTTFVSQNGWQAAFGYYSIDPDFEDMPNSISQDDRPSVSFFLIFYMLLLVPVMLICIAVPVLEMLQLPLPPIATTILQFRWIAVAAAVLFLFMLLLFQLGLGFGLESKLSQRSYEEYQNRTKDMENAKMKRMARMSYEAVVSNLHRGTMLSAVFWIHLVGMVAGLYMLWLDIRKTAPLPKIDVLW